MEKSEVVHIFGGEYHIKSDVGSERIKKIAQIVDERMREVHKKFPLPSTTKIAVLAFLNFVDEYFNKTEESEKVSDSLKDRVTSLIEKIDEVLET